MATRSAVPAPPAHPRHVEFDRGWPTANRSELFIFIVYFLCVVTIEALVAVADPVVTGVAAAALLTVLIIHFILLDPLPAKDDAGTTLSAAPLLLPVFALVPLLRLLSVALPTSDIPERYWLFIVGLPMLSGVLSVMRLLGLSLSDIGMIRTIAPLQLLIVASGVPLAVVGYVLIRPDTSYSTGSWWELLLAAIGLAVFSGLLEELIFRGLFQPLAGRAFGPLGVAISSFTFAATYLGEKSPMLLIVMMLIGTYFAIVVEHTRSIVGVVGAHAIFVVGLLVVLPLL